MIAPAPASIAQTEPNRATAFIDAMRHLSRQAWPDLGALREQLQRFLGQTQMPSPDRWPNTTGRYTRVLLNAPTDRFQIIVVFWPPGARSAIHDHADTWGAVMPLFGRVSETKYAIGHADEQSLELLPSDSVSLGAGDFSPITPEDGLQLHDMVNDSYSWAATIHVYLRPVRHFHVYSAKTDGTYERERRVLWFDYENGGALWDQPESILPPATRRPVQDRAQGGCACGALRFEIDHPPALELSCYCTDCQKSTGSVVAPLAFYPVQALTLLQGSTTVYRQRNDSGSIIEKVFCPCCGTTITHASSSHPHLVGVPVGVLDDRSFFRPTTNIYVGSAPDWAPLARTFPLSA